MGERINFPKDRVATRSGEPEWEPTDDDAPDAPPAGVLPADEATQIAAIALPRITVAELFAPQPPVAWLVKGLDLCPGAVNLIAGYGFSGKTVAVQDMALDVATGLRRVWGSFAATQGRVLHLDYEQGRRLTIDRYQRLAAARLVAPDDVKDRLSVVALPPLYLDSPVASGILERECEGHALLVVDSLRAACPSIEENDSGVRTVLDMLSRVSERTGVTVIVIHHARKPQKDTPGGSRMSIRGSGAIFDACASVLIFDGQKGSPTIVSHEKARTSGVCAADFRLRIQDVEVEGNPRGGLEVTAEGHDQGFEPAERVVSTATGDAAVLELVKAHPGSSGRQVSALLPSMSDRAVYAALTRLQLEGLVLVRDGARRAQCWWPSGGVL